VVGTRPFGLPPLIFGLGRPLPLSNSAIVIFFFAGALARVGRDGFFAGPLAGEERGFFAGPLAGKGIGFFSAGPFAGGGGGREGAGSDGGGGGGIVGGMANG